ncbi:MAG: hypothetical protein HY360_25860 [Verrucomicrobia bacterium]|nr:hypothetical protein [Verrucomicrobiota bacterium]
MSEDLSPGILRDLQEAMRKNAFERSPLPQPPDGGPRFGSVYFGSFRDFAEGKPHFGMVSRSKEQPHPGVPMAPITRKRPGGWQRKHSLELPHGTLPSKQEAGWTTLRLAYVLLFIRITVSRRELRERFDFVRLLPENLITCAKGILNQP